MDARHRVGIPRSAIARSCVHLLVALGLMTVAAPRTDLNPRSRLVDMITGAGSRPYVRRALVGWTVRVEDQLIPHARDGALSRAVARSPFLRDRHWQPEHASSFEH